MASLIVSGSTVSDSPSSGILSPRNLYTSLDKVRNYLSLASQQTTDDNNLKQYIWNASRDIDDYCKRRFYPERKTRRYDYPENSQLLRFVDDELLEVYGLSDLNGASEIDTGAYWPRQGRDWNETPYDRIELNSNVGSTLNFTGTPQRAIHLDGVWGHRTNYDNDGWINSGASLTATMTATTTMASVSGSAGRNTDGYSPRMWTEQLWKVDDEYMHVVKSESASRVRVIRGVNGTTATSHASAVTVETWKPEPDIEFCARELAAFEYMRSTTPLTGRITTFGGGITSVEQPFTQGIPPNVQARLRRFIKHRVYSF
jgi:hypothetical protein